MSTSKPTSTAMRLVGHDIKGGRPMSDLYTTPAGATLALLEKEPKWAGGVWEVAAGLGHVSWVLEHTGHTVVSTDLVDRGYPGTKVLNFLDARRLLAPNIVTNPPFNLVSEFIVKAYHLNALKVAMFLKLTALEGMERSKVLEATPLRSVYVFRNRVSTTRNNSKGESTGMMAFAWFVWELGYTGKPQIEWLTYLQAENKWNPPGDVAQDGDQLQFELG